MRKRLGIIASHPIQYQAPIFRELAKEIDLQVYFAHRATSKDQAEEGFGIEFQWDQDLVGGYKHLFLNNESRRAGFSRFFGCNTPQIKQIIRAEKFDAVLVMGWNLYSYWQTVIACKLNNVPVMVRGDSHLGTPRGKLKKTLKRLPYYLMFRNFVRCLYVGKMSKQYYQHYGVKKSKLFFSPHAVDNDWFRQQVKTLDKSQVRIKYGIDKDVTVVLFAGKLVEKKRPQDVIHAMNGLGERYIAVYAGAGEQSGEIADLAGKSNVTCIILGFMNQSEMPAVYCLSDVLVLPSDGRETWGLVVNEAMACGIPVVVSDAVGCAPDLVVPGKTGYVYAMGDVAGLRDILSKFDNKIEAGRISAVSIRSKIHGYSPQTASLGILRAIESLSN